MRRTCTLAIACLIGALQPAFAQPVTSNSSAPSPFYAKAFHDASLLLAPGHVTASEVRLGEMEPDAVDGAKRWNATGWSKVLLIGIGRSLDMNPFAYSENLLWSRVPGGMAAHWKVTSAGAKALRLEFAAAALPKGTELRFAATADTGTVYGPFAAADVLRDPTYWSPVLQGDSAYAEIFVPDGESTAAVEVTISRVSHLFVNPAERDVESLAKIGESQSCEVDLICRSATDTALANVGKAVARMTFTVGGATSLCTGTLLNPTGGSFTPYFYSAAHCISTQAVASTLTTHWFYDRTACGTGGVSASYVQLAGGATLRHANTNSDALLLQLNATPPGGAVFAGWDASLLSGSVALTAVHHPAGDVKKVSLATFGDFQAGGSVNGGTASFIITLWNSTATGVTEGGSSGSGIFSAVGAPATDYKLRGGLFGGPSNCTSSGVNLRDWYSRLDQVYPSISQYLGSQVSTRATDLNGDGKSDLLWRNVSTGQVYRMLMNGFTRSSEALVYTEANTAWSIIADADFNGDGVTDLLWRNSSTGQIYLMTFNSSGAVSGGQFIYTEANAAWRIIHTPDLNGDGKADLLWWNSTTGQVYGMLMNGFTIGTQGFIYTEPNTSWRIEAVGDFAGSGKTNQLVWRNFVTGQTWMTTVSVGGGGFTQTGQFFYQSTTPYRMIAAADFNGDGKSDLLWRKDDTGQVYMMIMNGAAITTEAQIYQEGNLNWKIVAAGDYDGNGKADILWRNDTTGQVYMMLMNGMTIANQALIYTEGNTAWKVLGPWEYRVP